MTAGSGVGAVRGKWVHVGTLRTVSGSEKCPQTAVAPAERRGQMAGPCPPVSVKVQYAGHYQLFQAEPMKSVSDM